MSVSSLNFLESCKPSWPLQCEVVIHSPFGAKRDPLQVLKKRILGRAKFV